jgi:hypothetical protein
MSLVSLSPIPPASARRPRCGREIAPFAAERLFDGAHTAARRMEFAAKQKHDSGKGIDGRINYNRREACATSGCRSVFRMDTSARTQESVAYRAPPFFHAECTKMMEGCEI